MARFTDAPRNKNYGAEGRFAKGPGAGGTEIVISDWRRSMTNLAELAGSSAAAWFAESLKHKLTGPRSGTEYWDSDLRRKYTASAPGSITEQEYPAERTGDLRKSIGHERISYGDGRVGYVVGSDLDYAELLAEGSRYMIARMFLYKHMLEERETLEEILGAPFYGDQGRTTRNTVRPVVVNANNMGKSNKPRFEQRKQEIIDSYQGGVDTAAAKAAVSRATSRSMASANAPLNWSSVMRNIREGKPNYYDFRKK